MEIERDTGVRGEREEGRRMEEKDRVDDRAEKGEEEVFVRD